MWVRVSKGGGGAREKKELSKPWVGVVDIWQATANGRDGMGGAVGARPLVWPTRVHAASEHLGRWGEVRWVRWR
jgi:hypothetical protein